MARPPGAVPGAVPAPAPDAVPGSGRPRVTQCRTPSVVTASRTGCACQLTSVPIVPSDRSHGICGAVTATPSRTETNLNAASRQAATPLPAASRAGPEHPPPPETARPLLAATVRALLAGTARALLAGTARAPLAGTVGALLAGTVGALLAGTGDPDPHPATTQPSTTSTAAGNLTRPETAPPPPRLAAKSRPPTRVPTPPSRPGHHHSLSNVGVSDIPRSARR